MNRFAQKGRGNFLTVLVVVLSFLIGGTVLALPDKSDPKPIVAYSAPAADRDAVEKAVKRQQADVMAKRLAALTIQVDRAKASVKATEAIKARNVKAIRAQQHKAADLSAQVRELRQQTAVLNSQIARLEKTLSRLRARLAVQQAAAARRAARPAATTGSRDIASLKAWARAQVGDYQFQFLNLLWQKESGWRWWADNPSSDAYGIPQSLPGSKMASAGADWRTNPYTQMRWGLGYIRATYGTCERAWAHSVATNWY